MRQQLISLFLIAALTSPYTWARGDIPETDLLPLARNLQIDGESARNKQLAIMILFVADNCSFCRIAKNDYIIPMIKSGQYNNKVIIRLINIGDARIMTDFHGNKTRMEDFARAQKVSLTPYVKVFDSGGNELTNPVIGIVSEDFYGMFLDEAIDSAVKKLHP
ncbi:MAG: hypothetical protein OEX83_00450 [Gammaproteobacteria bacterium]|nr:hypothetical protein [Gammaproteobacteria bacterium]